MKTPSEAFDMERQERTRESQMVGRTREVPGRVGCWHCGSGHTQALPSLLRTAWRARPAVATGREVLRMAELDREGGGVRNQIPRSGLPGRSMWEVWG